MTQNYCVCCCRELRVLYAQGAVAGCLCPQGAATPQQHFEAQGPIDKGGDLANLPNLPPCTDGSKKRSPFCNHGFFHQKKGKPPLTSCNVQVCNVRIPVADGVKARGTIQALRVAAGCCRVEKTQRYVLDGGLRGMLLVGCPTTLACTLSSVARCSWKCPMFILPWLFYVKYSVFSFR